MTSRYKVVEGSPEHAPGVDFITGTAVGPFIDTGKDVRFGERVLGRVYLSKSTVKELAEQFGLLGDGPSSAAVEDAYSRGKLDSLKEELGGDLNGVVATLRRWLSYVDPAPDSDSGA